MLMPVSKIKSQVGLEGGQPRLRSPTCVGCSSISAAPPEERRPPFQKKIG